MRCEQCGKQLRENAAFCLECGHRASRLEHAAVIAELAQTEDLGRLQETGDIPQIPRAAEAAERVPEIPAIADLPRRSRTTMMGEEEPVPERPRADVIASARLRETRRRAAQALTERLQIDLAEKFAETTTTAAAVEDDEWRERGELRSASEIMEERLPPPPPPPSQRERVGGQMSEARAERLGVETDRVSLAGCFIAGVVTLVIMIATLVILVYFMEAQVESERQETDSARIMQPPLQVAVAVALRGCRCDGEQRWVFSEIREAHLIGHSKQTRNYQIDRRPTGDVLHRVRIRHAGRGQILS